MFHENLNVRGTFMFHENLNVRGTCMFHENLPNQNLGNPRKIVSPETELIVTLIHSNQSTQTLAKPI
jgi:hypothetical protein